MNKLFFRLSLSEKILFAKYLAILLGSGISLAESLKLLQRQLRSKTVQSIISQLIKDVENGQFLSASLSRFQKVFGEFFINVIKVGEMSGNLAQNLKYLAEALKKLQNLRRKIISALLYPAFVLLATFGVIAILVFIVFPKILPVFSVLKVNLPLTTKIFIAVSNFFLHYGLYLVVGLIIFLILFSLLLQVKSFRKTTHKILLHFPLIGKIIQYSNVIEFCRSFGLLLRSNLNIVEALEMTSKNQSNLLYQEALKEAPKFIGAGHSLHEYLDKYPRLFPFNMVRMVEIGETTGNLVNNLVYLAAVYESEIDDRLENLTNLLEPILLVVLASIVAFIALSIIMPIYEITEKLGKRR